MSTASIVMYAVIAGLWISLLIWVVRQAVQFIRGTTIADLTPRVAVVSTRRAVLEPTLWVPISPWACRRKF